MRVLECESSSIVDIILQVSPSMSRIAAESAEEDGRGEKNWRREPRAGVLYLLKDRYPPDLRSTLGIPRNPSSARPFPSILPSHFNTILAVL